MMTSVKRLLAHFVCALSVRHAATAMAQDLTPRAYLIVPISSNATTLSYSHLQGDLQFDGAVPITDATAHAGLEMFSYYRSLNLLGRTASITFGLPYGVGDFRGTVVDAPKSSHLSGLFDSFVRFSVNLLGGPAMGPAEFTKWRQETLLGISLRITAPTGQYDPTKLFNWGSNRWAFKPEIGYSRRLGNWILDGYAGAWFFTENPEFFSQNAYFPGVRSQSQKPIVEFEGHLSYDFSPRLWISLDANFWRGGVTSLNGVENPVTKQQSSRVGLTASIPLTAHQSIKVSFSDGAYVRYGGNYQSISAAWQYGWLSQP